MKTSLSQFFRGPVRLGTLIKTQPGLICGVEFQSGVDSDEFSHSLGRKQPHKRKIRPTATGLKQTVGWCSANDSCWPIAPIRSIVFEPCAYSHHMIDIRIFRLLVNDYRHGCSTRPGYAVS